MTHSRGSKCRSELCHVGLVMFVVVIIIIIIFSKMPSKLCCCLSHITFNEYYSYLLERTFPMNSHSFSKNYGSLTGENLNFKTVAIDDF